MGCSKGCITSLNTTFLVVSIGVLAVGLLLQYNESLLSKLISVVVSTLNNQLSSLQNSANMKVTTFSSEDIADLIRNLISGLAKPLIILGCVMTTVALIALIGACCESSCLLTLYAILLSIVIVAQSVLLAMLLLNGTPIESNIKTAIKVTLKMDSYREENTTDAISSLWLGIMQKLECCGVTDYTDFESSLWYEGRRSGKAPLGCCKDINNAVASIAGPGSQPACVTTPNDSISNFNKGCYVALRQLISSSPIATGIVAGVCSVAYLVEVCLLISTICMLKTSCTKNKVGSA